jgi:hypothetical protein
LRVLTLLAVAHASLAFYLWLCAFDVNLVIIPARLWEVLAWSWVGWPVLLVVRGGRLVPRLAERAWNLVNGQLHHGGAPALRPDPAFERDVPPAGLRPPLGLSLNLSPSNSMAPR